MIRILAAFAWLRWRLTANAFRRRGGRDLLSRAARVGEVIVPFILALVILPSAFGLGLLGAFGGWAAVHAPDHREGILLTARLILGALTAMVFIGQLVRAMVGAHSESTRFSLLPIPARLLHASMVASGLADPWICLVYPGVVLFCAGLAAGGAVVAAGLTLVAALLLLSILLLIGSCLECLLQLLFRNRRRGEWVTLIATAVLAFAGFIPMFLGERLEGAEKSGAGAVQAARWLWMVPSELWGATLAEALAGRTATAVARVTGMLGTGAVLYLISWSLYGRLLASPAVSSGRSSNHKRPRELPRLPGLSEAASAVAWTQFRTIVRTVSGKSLLIVGPLTFALLVLVAPRMLHRTHSPALTVDPQLLAAFAGVLFSLISLPRVSANQFALDRSGLTLQYLAPLSDREIVKGKAAGIGILWLGSVLLYLVLALPLVPLGSPWTVPAAVLAGLAAYLVFAPVAAILAALLPKPADLSKLGAGGKPHPLAVFAATLLAVAFFAAPAMLAMGDFQSGPTVNGFFLALLCAGLAAGLSIPLTRMAAEVLASRREAILLATRDR